MYHKIIYAELLQQDRFFVNGVQQFDFRFLLQDHSGMRKKGKHQTFTAQDCRRSSHFFQDVLVPDVNAVKRTQRHDRTCISFKFLYG